MTAKLMRIRAIDAAGELVGKGKLADYSGIERRTMKSYTSVERPCPARVLSAAADGLERMCDDIRSHIETLRSLASETHG